MNTGRLYIGLKPRDQRQGQRQRNHRPAAAKPRKTSQGISLFMQAVQDVQIDSRVSRTQYQYTLQDADEAELAQWADQAAEQAAHLAGADRRRQRSSKPAACRCSVDVDREKASRLNILPQAIDDTLYDAFGQRQVSTIFTQLNQYRVILEADPHFQLTPESLDKIYVKSSTGQMVPLERVCHASKTGTAPLTIVHQGQFPAVTLSFNLRPGSFARRGGEGHSTGREGNRLARNRRRPPSPAARRNSAPRCKSEPFLILAAIVVIYIVLGVLYESYIHPITILSSLPSAGVGALLALMLTGHDLSLISLIGIILLIGIVKKNAIMMIDFALDAERERRSAAGEIHLPGLSAAVSVRS